MKLSRSVGIGLTMLALVASACFGDDDASTGSTIALQDPAITVLPDPTAPVFVANVAFTEDGLDPATIHVPAGHTVRLVLRNRTFVERHYRVVNLLASDVLWVQFPEVDAYDLESLSPEELEVLGVDMSVTDESEMEHQLHHLMANFVPTREESRNGVKPLPGEVHNYVDPREPGSIMTFTPLRTRAGTAGCS